MVHNFESLCRLSVFDNLPKKLDLYLALHHHDTNSKKAYEHLSSVGSTKVKLDRNGNAVMRPNQRPTSTTCYRSWLLLFSAVGCAER